MKLLRTSILPEQVVNVLLGICDELDQKDNGKSFGILVNNKDPENPSIIMTENDYQITNGILPIIPEDELILSNDLVFFDIETWKSVTIHTIFMRRLQAVIDDLQNKIGSQPQRPQVLLFDIIQGVFTTMTLKQYSKPLTSKARFLKLRAWSRKNPLPASVEKLYPDIPNNVKRVITLTMQMDFFSEDDDHDEN